MVKEHSKMITPGVRVGKDIYHSFQKTFREKKKGDSLF